MAAKPKSSSRKPPPTATANTTATSRSRSHSRGKQQQNQQQQHQQQSPRRSGRHSLASGVFWKLIVPLILLLSVFTIMDRVGRDIQDMYSVTTILNKEGGAPTSTHDNSKNVRKGRGPRNQKSNDKNAFGTTTSAVNPDRIAERRKKRAERRADMMNDREQRRSQMVKDSLRAEKKSSSWSSTFFGGDKGKGSTVTKPPSTVDGVDPEIVLFDYNQPALRSNDDTFSTTLNEPTANYSTARTIVFVLSARENFERRAVIRQTWGRDHAVYFVTGGQPASEQLMEKQMTAVNQNRSKKMSKNNNSTDIIDSRSMSIQDSLVQEQATHQDIIDAIHPESYRSLPHKLKFAYQWILSRWPLVQWLVKVDDDTVVRIDTLQKVVLDNLNSAQPIVAGRIVVNAPVHKGGKWAELIYPHTTYPYWPQGSCGHVVSRPVAEYVSQKAAAQQLILYQGEDTSLGIWLDDASTKKELHVTWVRSHYFTNSGECHDRQWLIIGHQISAAQMKACYDRADEWTEEYRTKVAKNLWWMESEAQKTGSLDGGWSRDEESSNDTDEDMNNEGPRYDGNGYSISGESSNDENASE
jgi:hypothetical protein